MMGFLWWHKRAQCLLFPWKLRCPTSLLKNTEMIQMNIQQRPTPTCSTETENSLVWDACLQQPVGVVLLLNTGHSDDPQRDTPAQIYTRVWFPANGVRESAPDERRQKPSVSRACFAGAQNLSGSQWDVRCEFWEDAGSTQRQRPFWRREDALTCQSNHPSVNSCLILCWKLVLSGSRGQRWCVSQPPLLQPLQLWLRGKIPFFF